jgi:hypothetical protein
MNFGLTGFQARALDLKNRFTKQKEPVKTETKTDNKPTTNTTQNTGPNTTTKKTGQSILGDTNKLLLVNTSKQTPGTPTGPTGIPLPNIKDYKNPADYLKAVENYNKAYESTTGTVSQKPLDKKLDEDLKRLDKEKETINNESFKGIKSSPWEQFQFKKFN